MRYVICVLTSFSMVACGSAATTSELPPPGTKSADVAVAPPPTSLVSAKPSAPASSSKVGHVVGITFHVPADWTLVTDGSLAVAKSPAGDLGFVFWGGEASDAPVALHRAEQEFKMSFPIKVGSLTHQLPVGKLPYGFVLSQSVEEKNQRLLRASVLSSKGVKTPTLALFIYADVSKADQASEGKRAGEQLDAILQTFEPDP